jgi:hypothetical protein
VIYLLITGIAFITVLVGGVVFYRLHRRSFLSRLLYSLLASSGALLGIGFVLIGAFYAALVEPWPLSLRQGPDTDYARSCFERHLEKVPSPTVVRVYCREAWGPHGDTVYSIRFSFEDHSQVERLAQLQDMYQVEDPDRRGYAYYRGPSWWPTEAEWFALPEAYAYRQYDEEHLWVDPAARIAYFQKAGF